MDPLTVYHAAVLAGLLAVLLGMLVNLAALPTLRPSPVPEPPPRVSVLLPARNEEGRIGPCLRSLLAQDYPDFEILVLDDRSEDGTRALVESMGFGVSGDRRILAGSPLPEGWTGKAWACHHLASAATGRYLLFTDADTVHEPWALSSAVTLAHRARASLLSAWSRLVTVTWGEKLVIPLVLLLASAFVPHAPLFFLQRFPGLARLLPRGMRRALGAANGQFLLFTREAYRAIGGHEAVKGHLVEDVALGREVAARIPEGFRLVNCDGSRAYACRMYSCFPEVWEGFTKNLRAAFEGALPVFLGMGVVQVTLFFLPFGFLFFPGEHPWIVWCQVGCIYLIRALLAWRFRTSWTGVLLHPAGHALAMAIALNSWRQTASGGVTWKGRRYKKPSG